MDYYNYKEANPPTGCQIISTSNENESYSTSAEFTYHSNGLPAAVKSDTYDKEIDFTQTVTRFFKYDHLNRLVADSSDSWYANPFIFYAYEGNSTLPVRDTVHALNGTFVDDLEYDAQGRIIKVTTRVIEDFFPEDNPGPHPDAVAKYYYDIRGNKQEHPSNAGYSGLIEYSDKPSLYSLHPVWQLIHKNYSKNSVPFGATFNEKGLPLTTKQAEVPHFEPFLKSIGKGTQIAYDCGE
jgi:hypothetical protein